jgi:hypothetical protein
MYETQAIHISRLAAPIFAVADADRRKVLPALWWHRPPASLMAG